MDSFLSKLLYKNYYYKNKRIKLSDIKTLNYNNNLRRFESANQILLSQTNTKLESYYKLRLLEIEKIVERYAIKKIIEFGSGRTTIFFNFLKEKNKISVKTYEQDTKWKKILVAVGKEINITRMNICVRPVTEYKEGGKFTNIDKEAVDLLYIDGPYINRYKKFLTFTFKPIYYDFYEFLQRKFIPKVIMIEGRTDTVDEILNSDQVSNYFFKGEFAWSMQRKNYFQAIAAKRHSIFIRKF
tara:strand:- start:1251 stop:1973 length:723 start_codon:yes stop_codon:yes gene_type:complete